MELKKDSSREQECQQWIEEVSGEKFAGKDFGKSLKDGILLCKFVNKIKSGIVKSISSQKIAFMQMQNINSFLSACKSLGVPKHDLFVTVDLFEEKNIPCVIDTIYSLGSILKESKDWTGPTIGKKDQKKKNILLQKNN